MPETSSPLAPEEESTTKECPKSETFEPSIFTPPLESATTCNLCRATGLIGKPIIDRYGYVLRQETCRQCGLSAFTERPTEAWYRWFYESGEYRRLVGWHRGGAFSWVDHDKDQWAYAVRLSNWMLEYLVSAYTPWLHIGADPEGPDPIAQLLGKRFGCRVDSTSDWKASQERQNALYGVSMCCRTLDHLLDIRGALRAVQGFLQPGGLFYGDILDTEFGPQEFKIDHPYQLTTKTMKLFLRDVGFELLESSRQIDDGHWSFLCRVP